MQIAIFDYYDGSITILDLPKEIEEARKNDPDFDLNEFIENLPIYDVNSCYWMSGMNEEDLIVKHISQEQFNEYCGLTD